MGLEQPIDITAEQRKTVLTLLQRHLPNTTAWVYGSRTKWTASPQSDLVMVVFATPEESARVSELREEFEECNLPFRVDLLIWEDVPEEFRKQIRADHAVLASKEYLDTNSTWETASVEEIAEKVAMGPFGSSIRVNTFVPEGVPVISGQHLHGIRVDDAPGFNFITPKHAKRLANANVRRGDVIFTHAGNIGQVAFIPEDSRFDRYVISQRQFYIRCDRSRVFPEFLAIYFTSRQGRHQLLANASQVGVPSIAQPVTYMRTIQVPLPPLREQRTIAHILGTLDDKIELNRRMNETVETIVHTLFKSWFVDFDPVRAKMEGGDTGLPPDVAALFPDRLVHSELGEIPEEWIAENLGSYVEFQNGYAFKSVDWQNKGVPVVKIGSVKPGLVDLTAVSCVSPETVVDLERFKLNPGDILVGMTGYPGETGLVPIHDPPPYLNQRVGRISAPQDYPENYAWIYAQVRSQSFKRHAEARSHGSAQANVSGRALLEYPVVFPGKALLETYSDFATPLINRYLANDTVSRTLATLRYTLLSKLISGDLRVRPGAQVAMEPVA